MQRLRVFSTNLIVNMLDALLAGFTQVAGRINDPAFIANPAMNYYFLAASAVIIIPLAVWITDTLR